MISSYKPRDGRYIVYKEVIDTINRISRNYEEYADPAAVCGWETSLHYTPSQIHHFKKKGLYVYGAPHGNITGHIFGLLKVEVECESEDCSAFELCANSSVVFSPNAAVAIVDAEDLSSQGILWGTISGWVGKRLS